jgi:hypothetical protein
VSPRRVEPSDHYGGPEHGPKPLSEPELIRAYGADGSSDVVAIADVRALAMATAVEVAVCRELLELLVDWAGARDRPEPQT